MEDNSYDKFFTEHSMDTMMTVLSRYYSDFNRGKFKSLIYDSNWNSLFIMRKIRHVSLSLHKVMPDSFKKTVDIFLKAAPEIGWWESMVFPDYVGVFGHEYWDISMSALTEFTKHCSSEFAIRPFLIRKPEKTAAFLEGLTDDKNADVRRYASEGCRPSHPWGIGLPIFKKDPSFILPILEKLKNDKSEFVRRSVANNLNAISKDNPEIVLEIAEQWFGNNADTDSLVKHACRTLFKKGNRRALDLFGFDKSENLKVSDFHFENEFIPLGERMTFTFLLDVEEKKETLVRLEYGLYFMKANGSLSKKVFKISEKSYMPGSYSITKRYNFVDRTTRKHYKGTHYISIIVNGDEKEKHKFILK